MTVTQAIIDSLRVYGIAAAISIFVAVLIKALVSFTGQLEKRSAQALAASKTPQAAPPVSSPSSVPDEVVAVISAAVASIMGPHRILHIAQSSRSWMAEGRSALHSHQPKH